MTAADAPTGVGPELAPAKLNLFLHLRGRRADGYHLLESLVVFPGLGDRLWAEPAAGLSLSVTGPFGDGLPADGDNLVLRAAARLSTGQGAALRLEKCLPVASGIGGGSADAAAALRLLARLWGVRPPPGCALALGADVPVCLVSRPRWMEGVGERLASAPRLPGFWVVLANPMVGVETRAVFAALDRREGPPAPPPPPGGFADLPALVDWLAETRNDLETAAIRICPAIAEVLEALAPAPLARMSGSGATAFALFADETAALEAAHRLRRERPGWWVAAAPVPAYEPEAALVR